MISLCLPLPLPSLAPHALPPFKRSSVFTSCFLSTHPPSSSMSPSLPLLLKMTPVYFYPLVLSTHFPFLSNHPYSPVFNSLLLFLSPSVPLIVASEHLKLCLEEAHLHDGEMEKMFGDLKGLFMVESYK